MAQTLRGARSLKIRFPWPYAHPTTHTLTHTYTHSPTHSKQLAHFALQMLPTRFRFNAFYVLSCHIAPTSSPSPLLIGNLAALAKKKNKRKLEKKGKFCNFPDAHLALGHDTQFLFYLL